MNFPQSTFNAGLLTNIDQQLKDLIINDDEIKQAILNDPETVKKLLQSIVIDELKADIKQKKLLLSYDFELESNNFINLFESEHTKEGYRYAINDFVSFCNKKHLQTPLECTPSLADEWIINQRVLNKSASTIRRNVAGVSSLFSYIERNSFNKITNPFRGTRARPPRERKTQNKFYSMGNIDAVQLNKVDKDIYTILDNINDQELKAIIIIMYKRGLRCGAFQDMTINGDIFKTRSKGKEIKGKLNSECLQAIDNAKLKHNAPFTTWSENRLKCKFKYYTNKLYKMGVISYNYSCHDLRHAYALREYTKEHDLYKLSKLLDHASVNITQVYLSGLGIDF